MNSQWEGNRKYDVAKQILTNLVDSLERNHPDIQFGLRVFGHQFHRDKKNCEDSKLEIPFNTNNAIRFKQTLNRIKPQGYTPLAYSIEQAVHDFPKSNSNNYLILISDGIESCDGNPCESSKLLSQANLNYQPFIVGLGLEKSYAQEFDCIGTFISAESQEIFQTVLTNIIQKNIIEDVRKAGDLRSPTSFQLNLLNANGEPSVTGIEYSLYDADMDSLMIFNIHAQAAPGGSDSIFIRPARNHELIIHTTPPIVIENVKLEPNKHTILEQKVTTGKFGIDVTGYGYTLKNKVLIRDSESKEILHIQDLETTSTLLTGHYHVEVLTYPPLHYRNVVIENNKENIIQMERPGTLSLSVDVSGLVSIYQQNEGWKEKVYDLHEFSGTTLLELIPGDYDILYRPAQANSSSYSQIKHIVIESGELNKVAY